MKSTKAVASQANVRDVLTEIDDLVLACETAYAKALEQGTTTAFDAAKELVDDAWAVIHDAREQTSAHAVTEAWVTAASQRLVLVHKALFAFEVISHARLRTAKILTPASRRRS